MNGTAPGGTGEGAPELEGAADALAAAVAEEPAVVAAWVFGSVARGSAGPLSDLDVAIAVAAGSDEEAVCGRVHDRLARRLASDRIDLVSFLAASVPLRYRIVRDGRLVACRDPALRQRLTARAVMEYLDFKPTQDEAQRQVASAIRGGD
jgi:predicted nucleotidyltransferase